MGKMFFGFALADSMLSDGVIKRKTLDVDYAKYLIENHPYSDELTVCLNPSHVATIKAMEARYGIHVDIPATPPQVKLEHGDSLIVMGVRGLPRLTDRHEYTDEEIANATFSFALYTMAAG